MSDADDRLVTDGLAVVRKIRRLLDQPATRGGVRLSYRDGRIVLDLLAAGARALARERARLDR